MMMARQMHADRSEWRLGKVSQALQSAHSELNGHSYFTLL